MNRDHLRNMLLMAALLTASGALAGPAGLLFAAIGVCAVVLCAVAYMAWKDWPRLTPEQKLRLRAMREHLERIRSGRS